MSEKTGRNLNPTQGMNGPRKQVQGMEDDADLEHNVAKRRVNQNRSRSRTRVGQGRRGQ